MKWKYVDKFDNWQHLIYYSARKKGCKIEIKKYKGKWVFAVDREKDDFVFNSAWDAHPNPLYKKFLTELKDTSTFTIEEMQNHVEDWVDKNVPTLMK
jgi:hypothetical protein